MLNSTRLLQDPRIKQAHDLIKAALKDHTESVNAIKSADPSLKSVYEAQLTEYGKLRGAPLWYPYLGSGLGHGAFVELADGSVKLDFIGGIGVHYFGHSHPEIVSHSFYAALSDIVMEGNLQQNEDAFRLTRKLVEVSGLPHCFLSSSGAMANENGLKVALQSRFPANRILAFERTFAGRTLALAQITDKAAYREGLPEMLAVDHVPFFDAADPENSTRRTLETLEKLIRRHPKGYAAMMIELVQGEGGFYAGDKVFFHRVIDLLKAHNIAIFVDEVQTFGRTTSLFAFQHFGLEGKVDIVSIGKLSQICATLYTNEIAPRSGLLSQTFTASVAAIRAAEWVIETLVGKGFYGEEGRIAAIHNRFRSGLEKLQKAYPDTIKGPFGLGGMIAFTYKSGDPKETLALTHKLYEKGLIVFINGTNPTRVRMLPPIMTVTDAQIDTAMEIIASCL